MPPPSEPVPERSLSVRSIIAQFRTAERLAESVRMTRIHSSPLLLRPAPLRRLVIEQEESEA